MQPSAHNVPQTEGKPGAGSARRLLRVALGSGVTFSVGSALCHGEGESPRRVKGSHQRKEERNLSPWEGKYPALCV